MGMNNDLSQLLGARVLRLLDVQFDEPYLICAFLLQHAFEGSRCNFLEVNPRILRTAEGKAGFAPVRCGTRRAFPFLSHSAAR